VSAAPGADDNASGSTAVLIAAELLSQLDCRYTLRYALFTGEEQGLLGSRAYVEANQGDPIAGVLNLDMIGWDSDGDAALDLYARRFYPDDHRLAAAFARVVAAYDLPLVPEILGDRLSASDHAAFWDRGIPAILAIEDQDDFNENYHKPSDRLAFLNLPYLTAFIQAAVGAMAHLACLPPVPLYLPVVQ
jgi:Zn-dependent M28 family amino/carboxypeptidase